MGDITKTIEEHFYQLSKKQQVVATFILNNLSFVATNAATEVGAKTNTSETTVIRFCYAIGLKGYAQLQREITLFLFNQHTSSSTLGNYLSSKKELLDDQQLIEKAFRKDVTRIDGIAKQIDRQVFFEATQKLHEASHIYIVGAGSSYFAVEWFHFTLNTLRPNVSIIPTATPELIRTLQAIDEQAVVVVISQHRYFKEPVQVAKILYERGIDVIGITDSKLAPIHPFCSLVFTLEQREKSTIDLMPTLISFLNVIVTGMMSFDPTYYNEQRVNFDDFNDSFIADRWS